MRPARFVIPSIWAFAVLLGNAAQGHTQPSAPRPGVTSGTLASAPVMPGVQAVPPTTAAMPTLPQQLDGRRDIRGCPMGEDCTRAADRMRELELEMFAPKQPGSPWVDDGAAPVLSAAPTAKIFKKPSDFSPELGWMDNLAMPDLPVRWTPRLIEYLLFYKDDPRGHAIMADWLRSQGRYRDLLVDNLRKGKLPEDLLYVAMIESSYDPGDSSHAGAAGLWQFMPEGGRIYGLTQDRWVDERRDPLRSTIAVVAYWQDLYQRFGDWHLAMAAFNAGYGAVLRSIARYNTNDYWQLCEYENGLAWETTLYVPKAIAAAIIGHNRATFGFNKVTELPAENWQTVTLPTSVPLAVIARAVGAKLDEVKRLNPHLRRGRTPPSQANYVVRVPHGSSADFARKLADLRSEWDGLDAYVVAHGERLEDIATTFAMPTKRLRELNEITHESEIDGGTILVVPKISAELRAKNKAKARIDLQNSGNDQKRGEPMVVAVPDKDATVADHQRVFYRVVIGDTLPGLARAFGVAKKRLAEWNGLDADAKLHPKMIVQAFVGKNFDQARANLTLLDDSQLMIVTRGSKEHLDISEERVGRARIEYSPTAAESFEDIGRRFGLTAYDMARINRKSAKTVVAAGDKVIVYQVVDRARSGRASKQFAHTPRGRRGARLGAEATEITGREGVEAIDSAASVKAAPAKTNQATPTGPEVEPASITNDDDQPITSPLGQPNK
ncbi:MAG: transglycosylase SLT domain-containing protein [Kofleriaceae bacterium]|nr:transglycosylase SLT domain-containing protein [Kofleriaceae bacterium]